MRLLLAALAVAAASPAFADMDACNALTSNVEMTACAWDAYQEADAELNDVWKQVIAAIKSNSAAMPATAVKEWQKAMTGAQKAWATFKDGDCNGGVAYEWYGGTGANLAVASCLYDHTVARTAELRERYLNN